MEALAIQQKRPKPAKPVRRPRGKENEGQHAKVQSILRGSDVQPKLRVGRPDDQFEKEADRVAEQVVAAPDVEPINKTEGKQTQSKSPAEPNPANGGSAKLESVTGAAPTKGAVQRSTALNIQRLCANCEEEVRLKSDDEEMAQGDEFSPHRLEVSRQLAAEIAAIRSTGQPLPQQEYFESRFGYDFSQTRVHTDARANRLANRLGARAFTHGGHIIFGEGQFSPHSQGGRKLIAHELTHVVQQNAATPGAEHASTSQPEVATQKGAPNLQPGLLDYAGDLWDRGTSTVASGARAVGGAVVSGARAVGGAVVRGGELIVDTAVDVYESARDMVIAFLERNAPGLLAFLRGDIIGEIKRRVLAGLDYLFNGFGTRVRREGLAGALRGAFGDLVGTVTQIASDLSSGDCSSLFAAINSIAGFGQRLMGPAFDEIRGLLSIAGDFLSGLWTKFGSPTVEVLGELAGDAWRWISTQAQWLWDQTAGVRRWAGWAWTEFKRIFGIAWGGAGDALSWLKAKALEAWNAIKRELGPLLLPLQIAGGIFLLFTPMAPIVAIGVGGPLLWQAIGWLRANWDNIEIIVTAREILNQQIIPALQSGLTWLQGVLQTAADRIGAQVTAIITSLNNLIAALSAVPIVRALASIVSRLSRLVSEALNWLRDAFVPILQDLKQLTVEVYNFFRPIFGLVVAIMLFPTFPFILPVVLAGWAWRLAPDCVKPPIIDFFLDMATLVIQAMPDFANFGSAWPRAKAKILETLQIIRNKPIDEKIDASNRIAKMMTGEDFTWIGNLIQAARQMPNHYMGTVEEELIGQDLNRPLPMEIVPDNMAMAGADLSTRGVRNQPGMSADDIDVDQVAFGQWDRNLIRQLNIPDGGEVYLGDGVSREVASPQGVMDELVAQEGGGAPAGAGEPGAAATMEPIPEDKEEQLEQLMNQPLGMTCGDNEKREEPATAQEVPAFARRYGPFTAMQRFRYLMNRMGAGLSHWFNCNRRWLVPTLIIAVIALIILTILTEGAILGVLGSVLEIVAAVLIGVSLVRMTAYLAKYVSFGVVGKIAQSARSLAKALAIGSIELVFALLFSLGPIVKAARSGFKGARAAGGGLRASVAAGTRSGAVATGRAARTAFVPGFEATARVGQSLSRSITVGGRNVRRISGAVVHNGRIILNGVQDGFSSGIRSLRQLRRRLSRLRFNGFSMSRQGMMFYLWGHFNPKLLILVGPGHFEDASLAGTGTRPSRGAGVPVPGRRFPGVVAQVVDDSDRLLVQAFEDLTASERRAIVRQLQQAADDAARRRILNSLLNRADDMGFPTTTPGMRDAVRGRPYRDPFTNQMVTPPAGTTMSPDHIFPVSRIRELDGFSGLTLAQQRAIVQDTGRVVDNIQPLPRSLNESKGNLIGGGWTQAGGRPINSTYAQQLAQRQAAARARIEAQIAEFARQNAGG